MENHLGLSRKPLETKSWYEQMVKINAIRKRNILVILFGKCRLDETRHNYGGPRTLVKQGNMLQSQDQSCLKILRTHSSPQECTPTGLEKLAGTSANVQSWDWTGILRNPQESCRNTWGTIKPSFSGHSFTESELARFSMCTLLVTETGPSCFRE